MIYVETSLDEFGIYNTTANTFTEIGSPPGVIAVSGLAFNGGTLYAVSNTPTPSLYTVNTTTGVLTLDAAITGTSGGAGFIASAPGGGTVYFLNNMNLYTVSPSGAATLVHSELTFLGTGTYSLNFGPDGNLYESYNGSLYRINQSTGVGTLVGSYGGGVQLGTLFEANGSLYGLSTGTVYTINLTTGTATATGNTTPVVNGLYTAATEIAAVPEPGSLALILFGLCLGARKIPQLRWQKSRG
jgi:hypothetical protein